MCFSASVSFVVSAALVPIGAFTVNYALHNDRRYLALAAFPLLFGIQQTFEGFLWLAMATGGHAGLRTSALGFLFFAYLFWPFFVPFAANRVEGRADRQHLFRWFSLVGLLFGLSLYLPLLIYPDWLTVSISWHSILYEPVLIYDGIVSRTTVRAFYAVIVSIPLLFSTVVAIRKFGVLVLISVIVSAVFFLYAFVSIWCFFAAVLSLYIIVVMREGKIENGRRSAKA
jgi:hypothetical protein